MAYKIPPSIERSLLDFRPVIQGGGIRLKPIPVKVILYWVLVFFVLLWLVAQSWVSKSPLWLKFLVSIWLLACAAYFGQYSKRNEMKFQQLPALLNYLPKGNRKVQTRSDSNPYKFLSITNVKDIEDNGFIYFLDGTVGQMYSVVGWGSRLLFDQDRTRIINRVDRFHRKIDTSSEWIYITTKEPQRVYRQIANLQRRNANLAYDTVDHELEDLLNEQYGILNYVIGAKQSNYNSLHQYLIIKSKNVDALRTAHSILVGEVDNGLSMFKTCTMLDRKATLSVLGTLFKNDERPLGLKAGSQVN